MRQISSASGCQRVFSPVFLLLHTVDFIYISDAFKQMDVENTEAVITEGLTTAESLVIDWIGDHIYFVESTLNQIEVTDLNGTFRAVVVAGGMTNPRSIGIDPRYGYE